MNDTNDILKEIKTEIKSLRSEVGKRLDDVEGRINVCERATKNAIRTMRRQQATIDELIERMNELAKTDAAIWHSRDNMLVGLDCGKAYDAFRELGYTRYDALKAMEATGVLKRGYGQNLTKGIRINGKDLRVIAIYAE